MRLYVNGVQVASRAESGLIQTTAGSLTIGGNAPEAEYWSGVIDEVRIYNRALSASEIQKDMNAPIIPVPSDPAPPTGLRVISP
jgi:hypothetical protein